jgi:hypothetical protein
MKRHRLTADRLHEVLNYDADTGVFTWLEKRGRVKAGDKAGTLTDDGIYIRVDGRRYSASRLAHLWKADEWPRDQINHRDGDTANNCWANLRPVTPSQKLCNRGKQQNNTAGLKGVTFNKRRHKFQAQICVASKRHFLGYYPTAELAHRAYRRAAKRLHGEFARVD